jgi:hypothetical protein
VNKKILFRIVIVLLGIWGILLISIYFSSNKYEDHVLRLLQKQLDNHLSTEIHLPKQGIHFSLLRNFPNASLQLNNILIKSSPAINLNDFTYQAKDTLLFAEEVSLLFNLKSIVSKKYELKKIVISRAKLVVLNDRMGVNNYNVIKQSESAAKSDSVLIQLKHIQLSNVEVHYLDAGQELHFSALTNNTDLSGEFSDQNFSVQLKAALQNSNLIHEGKNYLKDTPAKFLMQITKSENIYNFDKGQVNIMGADLSVQGIFEPSRGHYKFIVQSKSAALNKISFPDLTQFLRNNKIQFEKGSMDLKATISDYTGHMGPSISCDFVIQKAGLKSLVKQIDIKNIFLQGGYEWNANGESSVKIDTFSMHSDKSEIYGFCSMRNLKKSSVIGRVSGILELQKIMLFESIARRIEIDGIIEGELILNGTVSREQDIWRTDLMNALKSGQLEIKNAFVRPLMNPLPAAYIDGIVRLKGLQNVWFENVSLHTGKSDLLITGSVTDLPLFSGNKSIFPVYRCTVSSEEFHVEDFILGHKQGNTDEKQMVQLPDSMIVVAQIQVSAFHFGKFSAGNCEGSLRYQPKTLTINDFSMESQQGKIFSEIVVSQKDNRLVTKCKANFQKVDLGDMFYAFSNFGQQVISAENLDGALSGTAFVQAEWDFHLKPILENLKLQSDIVIENGELIDYQPLLGLSNFIKVEELRHIKFDKLETSIQIDNELILLPETNINSSAISLIGSGQHDFENRYTYNMQVQLSDILWNKAKRKKPENTEFGYVIDDGLGKTTIPLVIKGKDKEFEVFYDKKKSGATFRTKVKEEKEEFKRLLKSDEDYVNEEQDIRLEWDNDSINSTQSKIEDHHQNQKEDEDQEFIIKWDDE